MNLIKHKKPPRAVARPRPRSRTVPGTPSPNPRHHHWDSSMAAKAHSLNAILLQMIRPPSTQDHHRRKSFQPKPTRFYLMNVRLYNLRISARKTSYVMIALASRMRWTTANFNF
ncbi:hypothetical protein CR513_61419, partial [Mucuna pruriens]